MRANRILSVFLYSVFISLSPPPPLFFFLLSSFATPACDSSEELNPADVSPLIWNLLEGRSASPPARRSAIPAVPFNCIILSLARNECIFLYSWINIQLSWFCPFHDCECPFLFHFSAAAGEQPRHHMWIITRRKLFITSDCVLARVRHNKEQSENSLVYLEANSSLLFLNKLNCSLFLLLCNS